MWPWRKDQRDAVLQAVVMEAGTKECRRSPGAGEDVETDHPGAPREQASLHLNLPPETAPDSCPPEL